MTANRRRAIDRRPARERWIAVPRARRSSSDVLEIRDGVRGDGGHVARRTDARSLVGLIFSTRRRRCYNDGHYLVDRGALFGTAIDGCKE